MYGFVVIILAFVLLPMIANYSNQYRYSTRGIYYPLIASLRSLPDAVGSMQPTVQK